MSWNLVGPDRLLIRLFPVSKVVSNVDEGQGDAEPHGAHGEHGSEGDSATGMFAPDEEVDEDAEGEDDARVQSGGQEGGPLPLLSLQRLVQST